MYKSLAILFLLLISNVVKAQEQELIGKWVNEKAQIEYDFQKGNFLIFEQMGYPVACNYELDTSLDPIKLTLIFKGPAATIEIPALLKFIDNDTVIIEQFPPNNGQVDFTPDNQNPLSKHVLKRKPKE